MSTFSEDPVYNTSLNIKQSILSENFIGQYEGILNFKFQVTDKTFNDCMLHVIYKVIMYSYYLIIKRE